MCVRVCVCGLCEYMCTCVGMCVCVYLCAAGVATMRHDLIIAKPGISVPSAACVSVCVCGLCVYMCTCVGVCVCVYLCAAQRRHDAS